MFLWIWGERPNHQCCNDDLVTSTKFLHVRHTDDLSSAINMTALAEKANKHLYFLSKLRKARAPTPIMPTLYGGTTNSNLTSSITMSKGCLYLNIVRLVFVLIVMTYSTKR